MYYLDNDYVVQEYCYSEGRGWFLGEIGQMKARACYNSRLGAVVYGDDRGGIHIRVYYQGEYRPSLARYLLIETPRRGRIQRHRGIMQRWLLVQRGAAPRRCSQRHDPRGCSVQIPKPKPNSHLLSNRGPVSQGTLPQQQWMVRRLVCQSSITISV